MLDTYFRISKNWISFLEIDLNLDFFNNFQLIKVLFTKFLCQAKIWWIIIRAMPRMSEKCYSHIFFLISIRPQMTFKVLFTISTELHWKLFFNWCTQCLKITKSVSFEFLNFLHIFVLSKVTYLVTLFTQNVVFEFWHFPPIFVLLKVTCLVTLFDRAILMFQKLIKIDNFWHF